MPPARESTIPATRRVRKSVSSFSPTKIADKENATIDMGSNASGGLASTAAASRKKSRSKSMGPGGVDALKATSGNRRMSLAVPSGPPPRSILKPTMPILADIPPRKSKAAGKAKETAAASAKASPAPGTRIALRTEEEQQAAAREREREERERAAREKQVHDHREARRKSLANRRVSFAAEATLHTFHEIEYMQDSTTSTESTTTRRASSSTAPFTLAAAPQVSPFLADAFDQASSPMQDPAEDADLLSLASPVSRGGPDMDDNNHTLTSTVYDSDEEDNDNEGEEEEDDDNVVSDSGDSDSDEGDGATMVTVDADESTSASVMSAISAMSGRSASPIESTSDLDEALRLATQHAGAQADRARRQRPLDEDEEVIPAFAGWGKKAASGQQREQDEEDNTAMSMDMDMTSAMGSGIIRSAATPALVPRPDDTEMQMEMSMDVTRVYGGILLPPPVSGNDAESVASSPMILPSEQEEEEEATVVGEAPMELTAAIGGIHSFPSRDLDTESVDNEALEDMSMELTTVLGGVLGGLGADGSPLSAARRQQLQPSQPQRRLSRRLSRRQSVRGPAAGEHEKPGNAEDEDDAPMDMTVAVGTILPQSTSIEKDGEQQLQPLEDATTDSIMDMDMTTALGAIVQTAPSPPKTAGRPSPSPSAFRGTGLHRTPAKAAEATEAETAAATTTTGTTTPAPSTPKRASPVRDMIGSRSKSPRRPLSGGKKGRPVFTASTTPQSPPKHATRAAAASAAAASQSPFTRNQATGATTPSVVLTPKGNRRQQPTEALRRPSLSSSAFAGAGPASPKITAIFNRRASLADSAAAFVVGSSQQSEERNADRANDRAAVSFEEPSGQQDGHEVTQTLKDMIESLSPKKAKKDNPFKGRKSLHVGSAKGLLGKRPLELDRDDGDDAGGSSSDEATLESRAFVKRLRVGDGEPSPVKSIRLQQPPSVMETIGRSSRTRRPSFSPSTSTTAPPLFAVSQSAAAVVGSGPNTPRRREGGDHREDDDGGDVNTAVADAGGAEEDGTDEEHIHLQDFLNLANIHFMELETTKRRATKAPGSFQQEGEGADGNSGGGGGGGPRLSTDEDGRPKDPEIEALVTSVCKVPLLEMYQHACRELKNYIEEGRSIMREIEAETYEDNPPIFREYTMAAPAMRAQMDQQFKNIKIFARLQSKKQWYEWRAKLHQGLQEGLGKTLSDLEADRASLQGRRAAVDAVYPALEAEYAALEAERVRLETAVARLGGAERETLLAALGEKRQLQQTVARSQAATAELEAEMAASRARVAAMKVEREQYVRELETARRLQEERRRWSHQEISTLRAQVAALERKSGWAVTGAQGTTLSMAYRREIELVFDVAAFRPGRHANTRIDLWYIGREGDEVDSASEKPPLAVEFFLQCIRDQARGLRQADTHPGVLLRTVRASWDTARQALLQMRHLGLAFPTATRRTSDQALAVDVSVLLVALRTKLALTVHVRSVVGDAGGGAEEDSMLQVAASAEVRVVYGEPFNAAKMSEFLSTRMGGGRAGKKIGDAGAGEAWANVVEELKGKLLAQGGK